jgi:2-hydroxychromene-2-carboxylate isomerase
MARPVLDFWFDFASTYSYPSAMRIGPLADAAGIDVRFRPFLLGPIFKAQGWETSPFNLYPAKGRNMWRDLERLCADLSLLFVRPDPFPQNSLLAARVALAVPETKREDFCAAIFRTQFANGRRIDQPDAIGTILAGLDTDPAALLAAAQTDAIKDKLRAATTEAQQLGVFGAPTFITADGELFWGNDRLERALTWAQRGK